MRVLLVLAAILGAGCLLPPDAERPAGTGAPLTTFEGILNEGAMVPSFDGTLLAVHVFRPDAPEGARFPGIVNFSPYWTGSKVEKRGDNFSEWLVTTFVPRGYAVILAAMRGTGTSDGCFDMGGPTEIRDSAILTQWMIEQPWSDGKLGATGKSYDGTVANFAAAAGAPGLVSIAPVSGISEWYRYLHNGGLPYGPGGSRMVFNPTYHAYVGWGLDAYDREAFPHATKADDLCAGYAETTAEGLRTGATGDYTSYWQDRNYVPSAGNAKAALLLIHGLNDFNVQPDHVPAWYAAYGGPKKALLGQWPHEYPTRDDFGAILVDWFDATLKGETNGVWEGPAVEVQGDDCVWRTERDWPPTRATNRTLFPGSDGTLVERAGSGSLAFTHVPGRDPTPASGAGDHLWFESAELAESVFLSGAPELRFRATSDRPATAFAATLYDLLPNGTRREVNWAYLHSAHRNGLERSEPLTPGEEAEYVLRFFPQETHFGPSHRIGLLLASEDTGRVLTPPTAATNTVVLDDAALTIPTVPDRDVLDAQPIMRTARAYEWTDWEEDGETEPCASPWPLEARRPAAPVTLPGLRVPRILG